MALEVIHTIRISQQVRYNINNSDDRIAKYPKVLSLDTRLVELKRLSESVEISDTTVTSPSGRVSVTCINKRTCGQTRCYTRQQQD